MKILIVGDAHRTFTSPVNRTDDYAETVKRKAQKIVDIAIDRQCTYIVYPGDVFDSHKTPYAVVEYFLNMEKEVAHANNNAYIPPTSLYVFGQHDQRYHTSEKRNTPLGVLLAGTSNGILLGPEPHIDHAYNIAFYGASWGEPLPEILPTTSEMINVLVTHRMVIGDKKLWDEQEEYTKATVLLKETAFNLIITGDNHQRVIQRDIRKRSLVNMGSLMRSTTAQFNHVPAVAIYDTVDKSLEIVDIPCLPADHVFCIEKIEQKQEQDAKVEEFVKTLRFASANTLDFTANLAKFMQDNEVDVLVQHMVKRMLPENTKLEE